MSFSHKSYAFNWHVFREQLAPVLERSLQSNDPVPLEVFVEQHRDDCSDPDDGSPLAASFQSRLEARDVQEVADYALTYCYDPTDDFGLREDWLVIEQALPASVRPALLGTAFGTPNALFDPGRMGSYFQSPEQVQASLLALEEHATPTIDPFLLRLRLVVASGFGLYVTF